MTMIRRVAAISVTVLALGMAGPAAAQRASRAPTADPNEGRVQTQSQPKTFPLGWAWIATSFGGKPFANARPTLVLDENLRGVGFAGCNNYSATMYPLNNQGFAVGPLAITSKSCDKGVTEAERAFLLALRMSQKWDLVQGRLVISTGKGEIVFERAL